ncbi:MAG TPA: hypothetical protein VEA44_08065 [Caulobacter sp.]|nr:hypothetical protein [Caulobacter sp.]
MTPPKFIADLFTGPDGRTWHLGRVGAVPMLVSGLALPWGVLLSGKELDLMSALGGYGALAAGVWALVHGARNMDLMPGETGAAPQGEGS